MPYIGNSHIAGSHTNNLKIIDDISSTIETFDGTSSAVVDTSTNSLRLGVHRFIQGQRVVYDNGGGSNIGGLTSGNTYFVNFDSNDTIKLATTLSDANSNNVINISSVAGSGTSHTLTNSFDGINKKFKLTFGGGRTAKLLNAAHATIAINNVIQKPNVHNASFVDGYSIIDTQNILFKKAPESGDVFWGTIIAQPIQTFDTSDNEIDSFTADGSTTTFNLSKTPVNSDNILVTLDGVVQHPNDSQGIKSYNVVGNTIIFTSAPASSVDIQVRHIGFAGASSSAVTGFMGRTGNVAIQNSDTINPGILNVANGANLQGFKVEEANLITSSASGQVNIDFDNGQVIYLTSATSSNFYFNFRVDGSTSLDSVMGVNDISSCTIFVASSSHYCLNTTFIDGNNSNITTHWVGGSAPSAANGSGYDIYTFTIIKTASTPAYLIFANQTSAS